MLNSNYKTEEYLTSFDVLLSDLPAGVKLGQELEVTLKCKVRSLHINGYPTGKMKAGDRAVTLRAYSVECCEGHESKESKPKK